MNLRGKQASKIAITVASVLLTTLACSPLESVLPQAPEEAVINEPQATFTPLPTASPEPTTILSQEIPTPSFDGDPVSALEMTAILRESVGGAYDPVSWGQILGLFADVEPATAGETWEVGDGNVLAVGPVALDSIGTQPNTVTSKSVSLRLVTDEAYIWVETTLSDDISDAQVQTLAGLFASTAASINPVGGLPPSPGIDGDTHIHIAYVSGVGEGQQTQFRVIDEFPAAVFPASAEREIIYINSDEVALNSPDLPAALTRAYWQMVQFNTNYTERGWAASGLLQVSPHLAGLSQTGLEQNFMAAADTPLTLATGNAATQTLSAESAAYLYYLYLWGRLGDEGLGNVAQSDADGLAAISDEAILAGASSADELFFDWAVTNLVNDVRIENGRYAYPVNVQVGNPCPVESVTSLPLSASFRLAPYAARYHEFSGGTRITADVTVDTDSLLLPTEVFDGQSMYWTGQREWQVSTLTRPVDLTQYADAVLDYAIWYDIARGGADAAYVLVSNDDGTTWTAVDSPQMGDVAGIPAYVGVSGGGPLPAWLQQRVDLTPFAGQEILLRFAYVTDGQDTGMGVLLDNISLPQVALFSGAEADDPDWDNVGWMRTSNEISNRWAVFIVTENQGGTRTVTPVEISGTLASVGRDLPFGTVRTWLVVARAAAGTQLDANYSLFVDGDFTPVASDNTLPQHTLLAETFDSSCGAFQQVQGTQFVDTVSDGSLVVEVAEPNVMHVSLLDDDFNDIAFDVDVTSPVNFDGAYGVVCRYVDEDNYYGFEVGTDGTHRILAAVGGQRTELTLPSVSEDIQTGVEAFNHLTVACNGPKLSLSVNGTALDDLQDVTFESGRLGVFVRTAGGAPVTMLFDNVLVRDLSSQPDLLSVTPVATEAPVCDCSGNIYDCRDFSDKGAAQNCYNFCGGRQNDVHLLDADGNGLVCETVFP